MYDFFCLFTEILNLGTQTLSMADRGPTNLDVIPMSPRRRYKPSQDDLKKRLATFKNYPKNAVKDKNELADNGFMYIGDGKNDTVQCAFCGAIFEQWEKGDDITSEHRKGSRTCKRIMELDRNNFGGQLNGGQSLMDFILTTQNPSLEGRVPVMKDPSLRLKSFKDWTFSNEEKPSPEALAEAGLFYTGKLYQLYKKKLDYLRTNENFQNKFDLKVNVCFCFPFYLNEIETEIKI